MFRLVYNIDARPYSMFTTHTNIVFLVNFLPPDTWAHCKNTAYIAGKFGDFPQIAKLKTAKYYYVTSMQSIILSVIAKFKTHSCQPSRNVRDTPGFFNVVPDGQKWCDCPGIWTKSYNIHRKEGKNLRTIAVFVFYSAKNATLPVILLIARIWIPFFSKYDCRPHPQNSFY